MLWENELAYDIYKYLKLHIKNLPKFFFQVAELEENSTQGLLFSMENNSDINKYFHTNLKFVNFSISYIDNLNNHPEQLKSFRELINKLVDLWEVGKFKIILKKINNEIITLNNSYMFKNSAYISSPYVDTNKQEYKLFFNLGVLER